MIVVYEEKEHNETFLFQIYLNTVIGNYVENKRGLFLVYPDQVSVSLLNLDTSYNTDSTSVKLAGLQIQKEAKAMQ
jgi:hypothetical protein